MIPLLKGIQFFKDLDVEADLLKHIVVALKYKFLPAGTSVFEQGSIGDEFYIILHGKVAVALPLKD